MARSKKAVEPTTSTVEVIDSKVVGKMEVTTEIEIQPEPETVPEVEIESEVEEVSTPSLPSLISQVQSMTETVSEVKKAKSVKNENVWGNVKLLFDQGLNNKDTLAQIHEMYGNTNTSYACIAWYRNKYNKAAKSTKMTVEQLLNQIGCQFGQDQNWVAAQLSKV